MANQATFHAKISADARQFVQEVESANDAIRGLVQSYDKISKSSGKASGSADKGRKKSTDSEIKSMQDAAIAAGNKVTQAALENQRKVDQSRNASIKKDTGTKATRRAGRLEGPSQNLAQEVSLINQKKTVEATISRQKMLQNAEAKEAFAFAKREVEAERVRVGLAQDLDRRARTKGQYSQPAQRASGPTQQGVAGLKQLRGLQQAFNADKKRQLASEREISQLNRQQMDAMVTGRYALYDMANAYRSIAMGAARVTRELAKTVIMAAKFESSFTAVERAATLDVGTAQFADLRDILIDLSTQIPVAFDEISEIATLGAQMGISAGDLKKFTQNVASFSAVTGASIDDTAEKFGRISSLAKVPSDEFENLASSVLYAGFNAVATEKEILAMAESIAAAGANAGYSGKQIVGLSTALSSLGVQPEQARGVILRLFNDITRAAEGSTDKMGAFASMAGYTATEFQTIWKQNPEEFFNSFLTGLSSVESLTVELDKLGIVNTREINVLQRLSGNMDVYSKSIQEASQAYEEGTALADIYGKTADNLEAKFQQLINSFDALMASSSEAVNGGLKPLVDGLITATDAAERFSKSNFGQALLPIVAGVTIAVAAFAGLRFATSIITAQLLAMRVAVLKTGQMTGTFGGALSGLKNAMTGNLYATDALGGKMQFLTKQQISAAASSGLISKQQQAQILSTNQATLATRGLAVALGIAKFAMIGIMGIGIGAMIYELTRFRANLKDSGADANSLADAIQKDTEAFENGEGAIATHTNALNMNENSSLTSREASNLVVNSQGEVAEAFIDTSQQIERNTIALGDNYKQLMLNSLVDSEPFQKMFDDSREAGIDIIAMTEEIGISFADLIDAAAQDPGTGAIDKLIDKARDFAKEKKSFELDNIFGDESASDGDRFLAGLARQMMGFEGSAADLNGVIRANIDTLANGISGSFGKAIGRVFKFGEEIDSATAKVLTIMGLKDAFGLIGGGAGDAEVEVEELNKTLGGTSKALRTVVDYASDLQGIFGRTVDIEFGEQQAYDKVADGWEKISENAADAQKAVKDANDEILELTADKSVLEYQLSVAERYGDEKRAAIIRAKLAKVESNLADEGKNLADAQDEVKQSLSDNNQAGRENRDTVLGMVSSYQDLIQAAVEAGLEGQDLEDYIKSLKDEFYEQGESVGYSREELVKYADLFDGFIDIVEKVDPRVDIKFNSNITAAEQAFNEYMAKLRAADGYSTTQTATTEIKIKQPPPLKLMVNGSDVRLYRMGLESGALSINDYYKILYGLSYKDLAGTSYALPYKDSRAFAAGGLVTGAGTGTSDSIPARLSNGEFVMNAAAVRNYGTDFMNTLNQQKAGGSMPTSSSNAGTSGGTTIAYLSPEDRALLREVANRPVNLYADNTKIAQSVNSGNVTLSQRGLN
jgi:TP901 family phage tail tape measure protein